MRYCFWALLFLVSWSVSGQRSRTPNSSTGVTLLEQATASYMSGAWDDAQALYNRYMGQVRKPSPEAELLGRRLSLLERLSLHKEELTQIDSLVVLIEEVPPTLERLLQRSGGDSVGSFRLEHRADSSFYFSYMTSDRRFLLESISRLGVDSSSRYDRVGGELVRREESFPGLPTSIAMPVLHTDGIHLVFAQILDEGLGGYDLFLSRVNVDTGVYLKPTLLGLPFNSPANDYILLYDEVSDRTILVSDRACAGGYAMILCYRGAPRIFRGLAG